MKILALDIATRTGWAFYDTDRHQSSIECGVIDLGPPKDKKQSMKGFEIRLYIRERADVAICRLIDRFRPDFACLEQPLNYIGNNEGRSPKKAPLLATIEHRVKQDPKNKGGPNADAVLLLNQAFAVMDTVCRHKIDTVIEVAPKTWQAITSKQPGADTKERSKSMCDTLGIVIPDSITRKPDRGDAADAAIIAVWAAGKAQEIKMKQRVAA